MSLFGSLTAAISGLTAQSRALGNISDNIANSQSTGYKRVDTNFQSYITASNQTDNRPGSVIARPAYTNTVQGTIEASDNQLALAIGGQGFFNVALSKGTINGKPTFDDREFYTRAGDFSRDENGYLKNSEGYYLKGWTVDGTGNPDRTTINPIQVDQQVFNPVATTEITLSANLPAVIPLLPITTQASLYDSLGALHTVNLIFSSTLQNHWTMAIDVPDDINNTARGTAALDFGTGATPVAADGTIGTIGSVTGSLTAPATNALGDPAAVTFAVDFGQGAQTVSLSLGEFSKATGLTQYAGTEFSLRNLEQNGVPLGAFSSLTTRTNGDVAVSYDNGQSRVIARVPLVSFNNPDKLQRQDGQAFLRSPEAGDAKVTDAASNGVGKLVIGSIEKSNVDIASEFTKLIVAQRAYSANTKVVTTSDEMLQDTINMRR